MTGRIHRSRVAERFLRQLWNHQLFSPADLLCPDGSTIEVLHPGKLNVDGGPDFRDARIRIGGILFRGDVELHNTVSEWVQHHHHVDGRYNRVILHVLLTREPLSCIDTTTATGRTIPVAILSPALRRSFRDTWDVMIREERSERFHMLPCREDNRALPPDHILGWLHKLSLERLETKMRRAEERLKELIETTRIRLKEFEPEYREIPYGIDPDDLPPPVPTYVARDFAAGHLWHQVLYEGCMEALGYSKNREAFLLLSRNVTLDVLREFLAQPLAFGRLQAAEALYFGASGLLAHLSSLLRNPEPERTQLLSHIWNTLRHRYTKEVLHESEWQFFRLRPANFPTVRLAGAAHLGLRLIEQNTLTTIVTMIKDEKSSVQQLRSGLQSLFEVSPDPYWSSQYSMASRPSALRGALVGASRAIDIVFNTVIPLSLLYARIFRDKEVRRRMLQLHASFPPTADNTITRFIRRQLLPDAAALKTGSFQQGAIQLYNCYCTEYRCRECEIGKALRISPTKRG